jgi:hypothetical protein
MSGAAWPAVESVSLDSGFEAGSLAPSCGCKQWQRDSSKWRHIESIWWISYGRVENCRIFKFGWKIKCQGSFSIPG